MHGRLTTAQANLGVIAESDEEEDDEEGDGVAREAASPEHIPQAFSHFTFEATDEKKLVCDLQVCVHRVVNC